MVYEGVLEGLMVSVLGFKRLRFFKSMRKWPRVEGVSFRSPFEQGSRVFASRGVL